MIAELFGAFVVVIMVLVYIITGGRSKPPQAYTDIEQAPGKPGGPAFTDQTRTDTARAALPAANDTETSVPLQSAKPGRSVRINKYVAERRYGKNSGSVKSDGLVKLNGI